MKTEVRIEIDAALAAQAKEAGVDIASTLERALKRQLNGDQAAADRLWAENNALFIEAFAGGAEEAKT